MTFVKNSSRLCNKNFSCKNQTSNKREEEEENLINLSFFQEREKRDLVRFQIELFSIENVY